MSTVLGIDLGGTKIAAALYDATGKSLNAVSMPTLAAEGPLAILKRLAEIIEQMRMPDTQAVGVGAPGLIGLDGIVHTMPNIPGTEGLLFGQLLSKNINLPVMVDNDANCFALAEARYGAGKNEPIVVGITLGTGVGGGIVINGSLFRGAHGYAGEFGHMLLRPGEPPFATDDKRGDVEQFLSGTAMGRRCEAAGKPEDYLDGQVCSFMRPDIFREAAWLCASLNHALDPSVIIFGGSAGRALGPHLDAIRKELSQWTLPNTPLPRLSIAERTDAATLGAALLTR